jgi:rhamnulokinase
VTDAALVAVDLGASSGRVILGRLDAGRIRTEEVHRFPNDPVALPDGLHWDALRLHHEVLEGLRRARRTGVRVVSIGIDTWGCDVGWLDERRGLLGNPWHHRDARNGPAADAVHERIPRAGLYARNGLQYLPFNTLYQLEAARDDPAFALIRTVLLMPDLLAFWLTGEVAAERTDASTTGLLDPRTGAWDLELARLIGVEPAQLPPVREPGARLGTLLPAVAAATGLDPSTPVTLVGSHDTASAVAAVPAEGRPFAYVSSGTWSLVGVELDEPRLDEASRLAGFTNEAGVDGTTRYLHNLMGLWLLNESMRAWEREGSPEALDGLLAAAGAEPDGGPVFDADDVAFLPPGDMPARIADACRRSATPLREGRPALVRAILDSLAAGYARAVADATRLTGIRPEVVHVVGGGSANVLLCRLTAAACGLPVVAGPVEATALGNLLVQARALGQVEGGLDALRAVVRASETLQRYEPATPVAAG